MAKRTVLNIWLVIAVVGIAVFFMVQNSMAQDYTSGMTAYWKFDEDSGTVAYDSINDHDGAVSGATWSTGIVSNSLSFNGVSDYVALSTSDFVNTSDSFSYSVWLKFGSEIDGSCTGETNEYDQMIAAIHNGPYLYLGASGRLVAMTKAQDNSWLILKTSGCSWSADTWYHIGVTLDSSKMKIYVNGTLENEIAGGLKGTSGDFNNLVLGKMHYTSSYYFDGSMDEFAVFDRALTADEVQKHYQNGLTGLGYGDYPPVADAGPDQGVSTNTTVTLDGSGSSDLDGDLPLTYGWTQSGGPAMALSSQTVVSPTFTAPTYTTVLTYTLVVTDNLGLASTPDSVVITITEPGLPGGLTAYWKFDEGSGTVASDSVNDYAGAVNGATWSTGIVSNSLSFNGVSDHVAFSSSGFIDTAESFSYSLWLRLGSEISGSCSGETFEYHQMIAAIHNGPYLYLGTSGRLVAMTKAQDNSWLILKTNGCSWSADTWYHVAVTLDSTKMKIYVDGSLENEITGGVKGVTGDYNHLILGKMHYLDSYYYSGSLDEVAVFDRALQAGEVQQHYQNGLAGLGYEKEIPVADAGPGQIVDTDVTVTLDGSGSSDPNGELPLTFGWTQSGGPAVTLSDQSFVSPTFTAPSYATVVTYTLVVTDSLGLVSAPDSVAVTISEPPELGSIEGSVELQSRSVYSGTEVCADDGGGNVTCAGTDEAGAYELLVPAGTYTVTVTMERFLDGEKGGIIVVDGEIQLLDLVRLLGGDANDDCIVNILDLSFMGASYGTSSGDPAFEEAADINNDGHINIVDMAVAGGNFQIGCPVPWP